MKMLQYTVKRFVIMLFTLFIIATATFFLLAATPGDALSARVEKLPDSVAARMYAKYGLDKPVMERYVITMKGLVHGDFGESIIYVRAHIQNAFFHFTPLCRAGNKDSIIYTPIACGGESSNICKVFWKYNSSSI